MICRNVGQVRHKSMPKTTAYIHLIALQDRKDAVGYNSNKTALLHLAVIGRHWDAI